MNNLEEHLLEASGKRKEEISQNNPYREIGFDQEEPRLGWVLPVSFEQLKYFLESISGLLAEKENFVFIGMGGSVNGIKPLLALFKQKNFFTLDSLDPKAIDAILKKVDNPQKTLIVAISKSGTTKETQSLAQTLKSYYCDKIKVEKWFNNFLWLADLGSFSKLDTLGWKEVKKIPIQANQLSDIGGRFSAPHTQIFILPLFLLLNRNFDKLNQIYLDFVDLQAQVRKKALQDAHGLGQGCNFYFSPLINQEWSQSFTPWLAQLFEESLGGKDEQKSVKTIVNSCYPDFIKLKLDKNFNQPVLLLMAQMYYYQLFVAYLAGIWKINFVNQEFVEKYKKEMQILEEQSSSDIGIPFGGLDGLVDQINQKITAAQAFIEVVLYFWPDSKIISLLQQKLAQKYPEKKLLIFIGSDWNHQSYQAAFSDRETLYVLVCLSEYQDSQYISQKQVGANIKALKRIALATYQTLSHKSILYNLK